MGDGLGNKVLSLGRQTSKCFDADRSVDQREIAATTEAVVGRQAAQPVNGRTCFSVVLAAQVRGNGSCTDHCATPANGLTIVTPMMLWPALRSSLYNVLHPLIFADWTIIASQNEMRFKR